MATHLGADRAAWRLAFWERLSSQIRAAAQSASRALRRARQAGFRGANANIGILIDLAGGLAYFSYYPWLLIVAWKYGILEALAVTLITFTITFLVNLFLQDRIALWLIGLIVSGPLAVYAFWIV